MSKKMMSIAILASLAMALPIGADAKERFSSSHEPSQRRWPADPKWTPTERIWIPMSATR